MEIDKCYHVNNKIIKIDLHKDLHYYLTQHDNNQCRNTIVIIYRSCFHICNYLFNLLFVETASRPDHKNELGSSISLQNYKDLTRVIVQ